MEDDNDNSPKFNQRSYSFTVQENVTIGSRVGQVSAVDNDTDLNAEIYFSLIGGEGRFIINSTTGK